VIGYSYWQRRFGGDPGIVGKQILVDGKPATIVGVGPKDFSGVYPLVEMDGYLPVNRIAGFEQVAGGPATNRAARMWRVLGRLKPGVSIAQTQGSVNVIAARLAEQYPEANKGITVREVPERRSRPDPQVSNTVPIITSSFLALAALVLLVACMNVANVLLVRGTVRQREMGIRVALGAGRGRLVLQMLTESLLLALLGGAAGTILGWSANGLVSSTLRRAIIIPLHLEFGLDWRVFTYAFRATVFAAVIAGGWPALRASSVHVNTALREGGRGDSVGPGRHRGRNVLVVTQLAGALVLLIVAGLFVRSLGRLQKMYLGFDPDHVLNVILDPRGIGYDEPHTKGFYRELEARARTLPGVRSVALAFSVPMGNYSDSRPVYIEGRPLAPGQQPPLVLLNRVDPPYFEMMRVPLLRGRGFAESDDEGAPKVAIVNQTMARRFWPHEEPIGKRFSIFGATGPWVEVVGVAQDGKYSFVLALTESIPYFYVPLAQDFTSMRALQIRSSVPPESLITPVQQEIRALAPDLPIIDVRTMKQGLSGTNGFFSFRTGATMASAMGLIGLTLALVGVYGVISYTAAQRTHEIGIRMALGAERRHILRLILRQGIWLVTAGVLPGLIAAWALTRAMSKLFVSVSAADPLTYASVTALLTAIALWACYIPARRATRVDPMVALRYE
jgi:predicted permease